MPTVFRDFAALDHATTEGVDYRRELRRTGAGVAHIAVHGGGIEAGTAEAADAVARLNGQDYYAFVGLRNSGNGALHITSTHFDEPQCVALQRSARATVAYHGCAGGRPMVHLGGGDQNLKRRIGDALVDAGFAVDWATAEDLDGSDRRNICNRNASGAGVQLELSTALRASFFPDGRTSRSTRQSGRRTDVFERFVAAVAHATASTAAPAATG
jgi:phage replication-related protein YjqB (UPF0714/DUF867 family)